MSEKHTDAAIKEARKVSTEQRAFCKALLVAQLRQIQFLPSIMLKEQAG